MYLILIKLGGEAEGDGCHEGTERRRLLDLNQAGASILEREFTGLDLVDQGRAGHAEAGVRNRRKHAPGYDRWARLIRT